MSRPTCWYCKHYEICEFNGDLTRGGCMEGYVPDPEKQKRRKTKRRKS